MEMLAELAQPFADASKKLKNDTVCAPSTSHLDEEILDLSNLNFVDDECWLFECSNKSETDLHKWLYESGDVLQNNVGTIAKNIDTRTFTRPKRRFSRPSIEKYNEDLYGNGLKEQSDSEVQPSGHLSDARTIKPLHFDLTQQSASVYFDKISASASVLDSFQNMSPPSLVNSMCSSTFANLMENSFIKNDPVLREIRDTDFSGSISQLDIEPMLHSMTESLSSLSSDIPENFLKKVSFNEGNVDVEAPDESGDKVNVFNTTYEKGHITEIVSHNSHNVHLDSTKTANDLNDTFSQMSNKAVTLNNTFQCWTDNTLNVNNRPLDRQDLNSTVTIPSNKEQLHDDKTIENIKRLLDRRPSPSLDLNRLSYIVEKNDQLNITFSSTNMKRNSAGSTDSGENVDYMSLSSGSSKSLNKMLSLEGINAIVDMQERSLQQVMSTPKPKKLSIELWVDSPLSPISGRNSDPELSSCEKLVKTRLSISDPKPIQKQKSVGHVGQLESTRANIRASHPNLKMVDPRVQNSRKPSNLNSMGHTLKGSYTSLKPTNYNLPVAPPPLDSTATITRHPAAQNVRRQDGEFVKPQLPRTSGLPRPVTGIPRPVSRIPGPRNIRPVSKSTGHQGKC